MNPTITILHPGIETANAVEPRLAPGVSDFAGKRIALLDNGKVNAGVILAAAGRRLQALGAGPVRAWKKQHAAQGGDKLFPEVFGWEPDVVLVGLGD